MICGNPQGPEEGEQTSISYQHYLQGLRVLRDKVEEADHNS